MNQVGFSPGDEILGIATPDLFAEFREELNTAIANGDREALIAICRACIEGALQINELLANMLTT